MTFKTRIREIVTDPLHLLWIAVYAVVFFILQHAIVDAMQIEYYRFPVPGPYVVAGGWILHSGLERFSTGVIPPPGLVIHLVITLSVVLTYIVAPGLMAWALEKRAEWKLDRKGKKFPVGIAIAFGISGSFIGPVALLSLFGGFISGSVYDSMRGSQVEGVNRDYAIHRLNSLALKAQSFYTIPVQEGGGGRRWMNIPRTGSAATLTLEDIIEIDTPIKEVMAKRFTISEPSFIMEVTRNDSLVIWGITNYEGDSKDFINKNGESGRGQVRAMLTPQRLTVRVEN